MYSVDYYIKQVELQANIKYDEYQMEAIRKADPSRPMLVTACAGAGKTTTIMGILLKFILVDKVNPKEIFTMTYTNEATQNMRNKFYTMTESLSRILDLSAQFSNMHRLCYEVLKYIDNVRIIDEDDPAHERIIEFIYEKLDEFGVVMDLRKVYSLYRSINQLNNNFMFDEENVRQSAHFIRTGLSFEQFSEIRTELLDRMGVMGVCTRGLAPIMAFYYLHLRPDLLEHFRNKYKIFIVDEFQDYTLIYMHILKLISPVVIAVGDLRQRIYGFNGASPRIQQDFLTLFPNAIQVELSKSYRCSEAICKEAERIIAPNNIEANPMIPFSSGGVVEYKSYPINDISWMKDITGKSSESMILCRNNISLLPLIDYLYDNKILVYNTKFKKIWEIPVINLRYDVIKLFTDFGSPETPARMARVIPELSGQYPLCKLIWSENAPVGRDLIHIDRKWRDTATLELIELGRIIKANYKTAMFRHLLAKTKDYYFTYLLKKSFYEMGDNDIEYYTDIAKDIIGDMTLAEVEARENDKAALIQINNENHAGIKCLTMHSAKGLEANNVYLLDMNEGTVPNVKRLEGTIKLGAMRDAKTTVTDETNLLYVGITRAKEKVCVITAPEKAVPELMLSPMKNKYTKIRNSVYDDIFYDDYAAFMYMTGLSHVVGMEPKEVTNTGDIDIPDIDIEMEVM